ncbi:MAG: DNA-directed RNA polymerase subunit omega [Verrucomicrobiales bacterium]|jgi:DNA-directed RNA polymerase subunit omega|nr:DNA-directed RNA polymerase subunit omega [Verrucomicrobiales bacterium]MBB26857.1 DNA-directed RNA polymerase subunit omega [Verrucomicrobiaceae bacterium]MEC9042006.1 DNA-directed RNA polymerase subunit omega [Verrucomicrobiota bacterium]MAH34640.1 DNA-directed RNA polymerase subunit omega [Verrucomicrobiales bacterium]MAN83437.1 DNA-directed RNA polymerase subunit omega [Verrucomicrobiales bacterium]|tara:strand:+ start:103 stop:309 length:207 start_codon:yes stop_codon:yes gene_type:complete
MNTELVEKALEVVTDEPLLINLVSKRVQQLNNGRSPLITVVERMGTADIALTEIIEGKIVIDDGESTD